MDIPPAELPKLMERLEEILRREVLKNFHAGSPFQYIAEDLRIVFFVYVCEDRGVFPDLLDKFSFLVYFHSLCYGISAPDIIMRIYKKVAEAPEHCLFPHP
jgi:hypothetical protein